MNIDFITQGEELLKKATPGPWEDPYGAIFDDPGKVVSSGIFARAVMINGMTGEIGNMCSMTDAALVRFLRNHASELLQCAREVERLKEEASCMQDEIERLKEFEWKYNSLCK